MRNMQISAQYQLNQFSIYIYVYCHIYILYIQFIHTCCIIMCIYKHIYFILYICNAALYTRNRELLLMIYQLSVMRFLHHVLIIPSESVSVCIIYVLNVGQNVNIICTKRNDLLSLVVIYSFWIVLVKQLLILMGNMYIYIFSKWLYDEYITGSVITIATQVFLNIVGGLQNTYYVKPISSSFTL